MSPPIFSHSIRGFATQNSHHLPRSISARGPLGFHEIGGAAMLLERTLIPDLSLPSNRALAPTPARQRRNPVICISRRASPFWWEDIYIQHRDHFQNTRNSLIAVSSIPRHPKLALDKLHLCDEEPSKGQNRSFGQFVIREAFLDEEYWAASWLRAEAHWESVSYMSQVASYKRIYAEQEFYALKRRCTMRDGNSLKCICLVAITEKPNIRKTAINSVVGTLDLSIRRFLHAETFPGELKKPPGFLVNVHCDGHSRYAYVANLCVSKLSRRQGIANNMLSLASDIAISSGIKKLFVHVNVDNLPAQDLYRKIGFEIVEAASSVLAKDQRLLMQLEF